MDTRSEPDELEKAVILVMAGFGVIMVAAFIVVIICRAVHGW